MIMNHNIYPTQYELTKVEYSPATGNRYYVIGVFKTLSEAYKATEFKNFMRWTTTCNESCEEYVSPGTLVKSPEGNGSFYYRIRH